MQIRCRFQINLTNPCNSHCRCTMQTKDVCEKYVDSYFPICIGNLSYVTPCHAGCNDFNVFKHNSTVSSFTFVLVLLFINFVFRSGRVIVCAMKWNIAVQLDCALRIVKCLYHF